jgi:ribosomal protein L10
MKPQAHAATLTIKALAEDGEKLAAGAVTTYADITTLEQAKADVQVVTVGPKSVLLILENSATASPVHYRMVPAARASEP